VLGNLAHNYLTPGAGALRPLVYLTALFILSGGLVSETDGQTRDARRETGGQPAVERRHVGHLATDEGGHVPAGEPGMFKIGAARMTIPDLIVLNQDGEEVRFYSELIKDRVVVISFFFTRCVEYCPLLGASLSRLQAQLGERLGRDVFLISVSKDPDADTPARIRAWGEKYRRGRGWTLVTGERVKEILAKTIGQSLGQDMHLPLLLIGNDKTGEWRSYPALADSRALISLIDKTAKAAR
jgi:SCO1/SenC